MRGDAPIKSKASFPFAGSDSLNQMMYTQRGPRRALQPCMNHSTDQTHLKSIKGRSNQKAKPRNEKRPGTTVIRPAVSRQFLTFVVALHSHTHKLFFAL